MIASSRPVERASRKHGHDGICQIQDHVQGAAHADTKLIKACLHVSPAISLGHGNDDVRKMWKGEESCSEHQFFCVQRADKGSDGGAANHVDGDACMHARQ